MNCVNIIFIRTESWILKIDIGKDELIVILQFSISKEKRRKSFVFLLLFEFEVKGLKDFARPCLFSERISFFTSKAHDEMVLHHMIHGKALYVIHCLWNRNSLHGCFPSKLLNFHSLLGDCAGHRFHLCEILFSKLLNMCNNYSTSKVVLDYVNYIF